jgi:acetyl-CoA acetyltransferase
VDLGLVTFSGQTAIVGVGTTAYGARGEFADRSPVEMIGEALDRALEDAGLRRSDVDGFSSYLSETNDPSLLALALGISEVRYSGMVLGGGGGGCCAAVANAAAAVATGQANVVMVFKALSQPPTGRYGAAYSGSYSGDARSAFHQPFGLLSPGQACAMIFRRHMHLYGTGPQHLAEVAVATREHARRNPLARKRTPMSHADHQASRMISDPFRLLDYCQENDGAAVVLVARADDARALRQPPAYVLATAHGGDSRWSQALTLQNAADDVYASGGHRPLARRMYEMAGIGPDDVDVALLYDHFTGMVLLQLEDYGFCGIGESGAFVESGAIRWPNGRLPVNTHGGHLSEVYILGMTHVIEGVRQMRGSSTCQVGGAKVALVTAGSSNVPSSALLLGSSA